MHYYKSTELADLYGVSRRTVTNWVKQVQDGKLDLELVNEEGALHIAKSFANQIRIDSLVKERRKYLNTLSKTQVRPAEKFYQTYNEKQIRDIIHELAINKELPLQYSYFGEGADIWNGFRSRPGGTFDPEIMTPAIVSYLDALLERYDKVNIVDVGVGNGRGAKPLIEYLNSRNKFKRYIGIDISPSMLRNTANNLKKWFGNNFEAEMHIKDVSQESFGDIIAEPVDPGSKQQTTINLVLLFGGSISNFKVPSDVLRVINKSMGVEDLFLSSFRMGIPQVKNELGFITFYQQQYELVLNMLGITEEFYTTEIGYDENEKIRYGKIRLKKMLQVEFDLPRGKWYVNLNKDDTVLIYRAHYNDPFTTPKNLFYANGLNPILTAQLPWHTSMFILADLTMNKDDH